MNDKAPHSKPLEPIETDIGETKKRKKPRSKRLRTNLTLERELARAEIDRLQGITRTQAAILERARLEIQRNARYIREIDNLLREFDHLLEPSTDLEPFEGFEPPDKN